MEGRNAHILISPVNGQGKGKEGGEGAPRPGGGQARRAGPDSGAACPPLHAARPLCTRLARRSMYNAFFGFTRKPVQPEPGSLLSVPQRAARGGAGQPHLRRAEPQGLHRPHRGSGHRQDHDAGVPARFPGRAADPLRLPVQLPPHRAGSSSRCSPTIWASTCHRNSKTEVLFALNQLLLERAQNGRTTALIVDEAHNLDWDVLEEIRLLGNLENRRGKTAADRAGRPAGIRPQAGCARVPPVEAAHRPALHAEAVRRGPDGGVYRLAPGPRRHAGPEGLPPGTAGRDPRADRRAFPA